MNAKEYKDAVAALDTAANKTADSKRKAYAGDGEDVLKNFKRQAAFEGKSKYHIIQTFMNKHMVSINNAIEADPERPIDYSEGMRDRLVDLINYARLLWGCLVEDGIEDEPHS